MTTTTRRVILAGRAAAPIVGLPAVAEALPAIADPVFALIEEWRRLEDVHIAAIDENDRLGTKEADEAQSRACRAVQEFERTVLFEARPTTSAGAAALLRIIADLIELHVGGECAPALRAAAAVFAQGVQS